MEENRHEQTQKTSVGQNFPRFHSIQRERHYKLLKLDLFYPKSRTHHGRITISELCLQQQLLVLASLPQHFTPATSASALSS